ncbi:Hypothetical protein I595_3100 [Croceitalea dokdonensis DOKDO 023]|uniref:YdhG-like domain-containing protein n=1 Tax=Croceitalea dokdonensis DOKDO 023 TaxID=1300341 RepID=A0A0P7ABQ8_9FLAO|nr:DUF1801 domain-containing protein [Croceitalea dokdonensis]KPM30606.1 Hypothetical protein I595_3100 [Croceitalea dokdonensis DOKDO 023]
MNPAEEYILSKNEPYRSILLHVQAVIMQTIPSAELKYKWRIPCFYVGKSPICYLNVPPRKNYVDVGFWNSAHLTKHLDNMVTEKRKVVKSLRYLTLEDIDDTILIAVLRDAYSVRHEGFYKN